MDSIKKQATDESPHIVEMGTITELTTTRTPPNSTSTITATSTTCTGAHRERHTSHSDVVRDTIIGFADGLTVPFALTAGLSSLGSGRLVVLAGLAELCSGALSMGLGAYLAAATAQKHYEVEEARERREVREQPLDEEEEIYEIMAAYGVSRGAVSGVVEELKRCPEQWVNFMMAFELRLEKPKTSRNWISALVMGSSYFIGGLVPMIPYFIFHDVNHALFTSVGITAVILLVFGYTKAIVTGTTRISGLWSALQTLVVGAIAAGTSYGIVRGVNSAKGLS